MTAPRNNDPVNDTCGPVRYAFGLCQLLSGPSTRGLASPYTGVWPMTIQIAPVDYYNIVRNGIER